MIIHMEKDTTIEAIGSIGPGGAYHDYRIIFGTTVHNIHFQTGPVNESGINGLQMEHLLHIVKHRLECFQSGPFPSSYNENALFSVVQALEALNKRTLDRLHRKVEGKNQL